jgi:uncharacterized membrane protein SpoIIM required for sporulation
MWKALSLLNLTFNGRKAQQDRKYTYNLIFTRVLLTSSLAYVEGFITSET